jgi:hypothetical protein
LRQSSAFGLIHHVRKTNGSEVTVEDGRGAIALVSAARAARAINQMTQEEADKWGVENRRLHFRYFDGKANLAPPSETSTWFKFASVDLGNATDTCPSDWLGVVTRWTPPKPFDDVTEEHMHDVRRRVADGQWRLDSQSADWVGTCVADVLGLDLSDKAAKARVKIILKTWFETGALKSVTKEDRSQRGQEQEAAQLRRAWGLRRARLAPLLAPPCFSKVEQRWSRSGARAVRWSGPVALSSP